MTSLNDTRRLMLATIAQEPRDVRFFTDGRVQNPLTERTCKLYLDQMVEDGLLANLDGLYVITRAGLAALEASRLTPPANYGNASTITRYEQKWAAPARGEGSMRAFGLPSLGFGA